MQDTGIAICPMNSLPVVSWSQTEKRSIAQSLATRGRIENEIKRHRETKSSCSQLNHELGGLLPICHFEVKAVWIYSKARIESVIIYNLQS